MELTRLSILTLFLLTAVCQAAVVAVPPDKQAVGSASAGQPEYRITSITLPDQARWIEPGMSISPTVTVINDGANDTGAETRVLSAYLGSSQLPPKRNTIPPLRSGGSEEVTLEYLVPDGIPPRDYQFFLSFDNNPEKTGMGGNGSQIRASNLVSVKFKPPKANGGCHCS